MVYIVTGTGRLGAYVRAAPNVDPASREGTIAEGDAVLVTGPPEGEFLPISGDGWSGFAAEAYLKGPVPLAVGSSLAQLKPAGPSVAEATATTAARAAADSAATAVSAQESKPPSAVGTHRVAWLVDGLNSDGGNFSIFTSLQFPPDYAFRYFRYSTTGDLNAAADQLAAAAANDGELPSKVVFVGYSLGGLVAVMAAAQTSYHPGAIVTFDSPLQGMNMTAKNSVRGKLMVAGLLVGAATGGAGYAAAGVLIPAAIFPSGTAGEQLEWIHENPTWVTDRNRTLASRGVRLLTLANQADCVYWFAMCAADLGSGDSDDRASMHLGGASEQTINVDIAHRAQHSVGLLDVLPSHHDIIERSPVLDQVRSFLASV